MRLIDKTAVLEILDILMSQYALHNAYDMVNELPEVDAVPVIRCKDCKYWQYNSCFVESEEGDADSIILNRFAFDFCSRAEREEE